jgi:hypothetical protein
LFCFFAKHKKCMQKLIIFCVLPWKNVNEKFERGTGKVRKGLSELYERKSKICGVSLAV